MSAPFDLVCLSHLRWDFVYQRPQHLLTRCAGEHRVFFVEEPIFDAPTPRLEIGTRDAGVRVVTPHFPPGLSGAEVDALQRQLLDDLFAQYGIDAHVLWYYTPMALSFTDHLRPLAVIYDCMDELSAFAKAPPALHEREAELFARADLIFTGGRSLYDAKRHRHPQVYFFPSSVDTAHFTRARSSVAEPEDQASIPRPRLGFYGVIDERMDLDLLAAVADLQPEWHLVVVGPVAKIDPAVLPRRDNIHFLGAKSYAELPAYLAGWDVALLPFAHNEATRFISPTKTPEYLAAGKPVVSTSIKDVVSPYAEHGLVHIADTAAAFVAAIHDALCEDHDARLAAVDAFLAQTSWDRTWQRMSMLIDAVATPPAALATVTPAANGHGGLDGMSGTLAANGHGGRGLAATPGTLAATPAIDSASRTIHAGNGRSSRLIDYLVVGAGFAGSVLAERLASQCGKRVLIVDKRNHIGGNAYDCYDDAGILIHKYGPHIFHTNSADVFGYLSQFTQWRPYQHRVRASVDGQLLPIPINLDTVNQLYGLKMSVFELDEFFASVAEPKEQILTSEDVVVSKVGRDLYEKFFRNYTRKQWGLDPSELDAAVTARVPVRNSRDDRYFADKYQAMPLHGFTRLFEQMLAHPNIKVLLNTDYREIVDMVPFGEMIYTGPIDEFFDCRYGRLPYRSLQFDLKTIDSPVYQPAPVVNFPNDYAYTRITEFKYLTGQEHPKTTIVYEYPCAEGDPYYPVPRTDNAALYAQYKALADETPGVHFVGRLATYKYYNMDQVVAQALAEFNRIIGTKRASANGKSNGHVAAAAALAHQP